MSKRERRRRWGRTASWRGIGLAACALWIFASGCATSPPSSESRLSPETRRLRSDAALHYRLGMQHLRRGEIPLAIREYRSAAELLPEDPYFQVALATAYRLRGRAAEAERHFLRALEIQPQLQPALFDLSALYLQLERYEEARRYAQLLAEDPTYPRPWQVLTNLAWAEYRLGDPDAARGHLNSALRYRKAFWPAQLNLGIIDAEQGRYRQALEWFEEVLTHKPAASVEAEVLYRMGELRLRLGERARAVPPLEEVVRRFPDEPWAARGAEVLKLLRASADRIEEAIGTP